MVTTSRYAFPCVHVDINEHRPDSLTSLGAAIEIGGRVDWTRGQLHIVGGAVVVEHHPKCAVPIWARRKRSWRSYLDEHGLHRVVRIRSTVQSVHSVPLSLLSTKFNFCKTVQYVSYIAIPLSVPHTTHHQSQQIPFLIMSSSPLT